MKKSGDDNKAKSWILLTAGLAGIGYQQWSGRVNWLLLLIFTAMTGVPGLASIISLVKNSQTILQSSYSRQELLEQESDSSLPSTSEVKDD